MENMSNGSDARESIFQSIRSHLLASVPHDAIETEIHHATVSAVAAAPSSVLDVSLVELFKDNLEAVDGHCIVVQNELEVVRALTDIITDLQGTNLRARRIALSDDPEIERLVNLIGIEVDEVVVAPSSSEVFNFDVGISHAQAGIAETGTLLLDSSR